MPLTRNHTKQFVHTNTIIGVMQSANSNLMQFIFQLKISNNSFLRVERYWFHMAILTLYKHDLSYKKNR